MRRGLTRAVSFLIHRSLGKPAVIIGGGMSRSRQVERCPPPGEAIYISANHHGAELWPCDYIVCLDMIEPKLRTYGVPLVCPRTFADVRMIHQPANQSGMVGAYLAWVLGCSPILLCGMDLFQGGTYESNPKAPSSGLRVPLPSHVERWGKLGARCVGADIRSMGGPLVDAGVFPLHDPALPGAPAAPAAEILGDVGGWVLEPTRDFASKAWAYERGKRYEVAEYEATAAASAHQGIIVGETKRNASLLRTTYPARRRGAAAHAAV